MPKIITIIGQKEVGKTTLFRQLTRKYSPNTIRQLTPLVNYVEELINIENNVYKLIDTPPLNLTPKMVIEKEMRKQIGELIKKSDLILWVIDKISEDDLVINQYLKKIKVPQILLFNKIDLANSEENFSSYLILRPKHHFFFSAHQGTNLDSLTEKIKTLLPTFSEEKNTTSDKGLSILIFGAPNSGKSTLMNYLLQENRSLVTPIAGTTQEPVISFGKWKQINFQLVDTAGITKEQKIQNNLWKNCDLVWAVIDASLPLTKQILQIVSLSEKHNKALIIIINKCDLVTQKEIIAQELKNRLKSLSYCPLIFLSALKGQGINLLMKILAEMRKQAQKKLTRKELTDITEKMLANNPPNYYQGGKLKIYFAKQEPGLTHQFIFFINNPRWVHFSYQRYMTNYLRKNLGLEYLPIKVFFRQSV